MDSNGAKGLLQLPPEVLLLVLGMVDPRDLIRLRLTCRRLQKLTYDHAVWVSKLNEQAAYLPLPPDILHQREHDKHLLTFSENSIESTVLKGQRICDAWPRARLKTPIKLKDTDGRLMWIGLNLVADRWLVATYHEGIIHIYDTKQGSPVLQRTVDLQEKGWTSFSVGIDPTEKRLIIALCLSHPPYRIHIYQIELLAVNQAVSLIRIIILPHYKIIQALDIPNRLVIVSTAASVTTLKWDEDYDPEARDATFNVNAEDEGGWWDGVIGVCLLGSYILVHKTRSLHVRQYKDRCGSALKHKFTLSFKQVSFSASSKSTNKLSGTTVYEVSTFAYDVIQGLFQFNIKLTVPESFGVPPSLDVQLTSVYPLALGVIQPIASSQSAPHPSPSVSSPDFSPSPSFKHTHATRASDTSSIVVHPANPAADTDYRSRGFLSTQCMGPQGKRGIWVERQRSGTVRDLQVWFREPSEPSSSAERALSEPSTAEFPLPVMEIERRVIYTLQSYDLRDDILISTFNELNGTIYLGHRSGYISVIALEC
ncbi:hypothetical protein JR316_0008410 [Psilocybe cubensis]|uniref:Uncharacterized protein n=2 Tax=Psilocybe cubensis TaxID=181762 RepID=A0ACB8GVQ5_PSICU|nr:hypothetical protein JR316_0008410 [Psilocybe cubensis]KAH9479815.1 hypothetical protein JR316_0008410 [Psilocybe cubensis]